MHSLSSGFRAICRHSNMATARGVILVAMLASAFASRITVDEIQEMPFIPSGDTHLDYMAKMFRVARMIQTDPNLREEWDARTKRIQERVDYPFPPFECDVETSPSVPTSVHQLRPSDIKMIAAMGDSITAGNGADARGPLEVAYENRGQSWCIGGDKSLDEEVITISNLLRKFNPDLKGYSICRGGEYTYEQAWMNRAVPGATSDDMGKQALDLIERAKNDSRIDFEQDWKMVTMWVGGNDLCASCRKPDKYDPEPWLAYMKEGLDALHSGLPRTLVNVITMFDVTPVYNMSTGQLCDILHRQFCDCVVNDTTRPQLKPRQEGYYEKMEELINSGAYDDRDDFTVVHQTMFKDAVPPIDPDTGDYDTEFLSHDCFHPSLIAHQAFANMLWQTLFIPVGEKPLSIPYEDVAKPYACPTVENPYIFTNLNSGNQKVSAKRQTGKKMLRKKNRHPNSSLEGRR